MVLLEAEAQLFIMNWKKIQKYFIAFGPSFLWAGVIFIFSSQSVLPTAATNDYDFILKKGAHMFVYAVLFFLLNWGFSMTKKQYNLKEHWYVPTLICLLYAISDEIHQNFVVNRHPTISDIGYDMLGVFAVYLKKTESNT